MSERPAAAGSAEFGELWRRASKLTHSKNTVTSSSPVWRDLQSPKRRPPYRYPGLNNGDSPGEGEASQDIVWDSTSPTRANGGVGLRNTRVVEISDIVNRIAPKDVKPVGPMSPLQQWIGDSAVPCTPEVPKPRLRKKSVRHNSVEDLMKLARQFDKNMQQDKESSEQQNSVNSNVSERPNSSDTKLTKTALLSKEKELKCSTSSSSDRVEAELHALFDSSTQAVSGRLSQGSSASACSQEMKGQPKSSARPHQAELKSDSAARKAQDAGSRGLDADTCDDFDDDWENDDLLNDSLVLALTNGTLLNTASVSNSKTNAAQFTSVCKPAANTHAASRAAVPPLQPSCSALQELCPKPKTTNRSTFKLAPNPHFQTRTTASKEDSKSAFTALQSSKSHMSDRKSTTKTSSSVTLSTPRPDKPDSSDRAVTGGVIATDCAEDVSDCLWGDGADDELLYQVCDTMERICNSQSQQASLGYCKGKQDIAADKQRKTTAAVPIETAGSTSTGAGANRKSSHAFVRSNSLPGSCCDTVNYQGWNIPIKGANSDSRMAQSLPGGCVSLGTFNQSTDSSGTFQAANTSRDMQPHTVTARPPEKPRHTAFKRNLSDSATTSNKVFVTSKMTGKCSAAEIERKKQEALARRRSRMQNAPKP